MSDVLENILVARRRRLAEAQSSVRLEDLEKFISMMPPPVSFFAALSQPGTVTVIAEMKRRSPSAGSIREPYDVEAIAQAYEKGGASALSVLTEYDSFGGDIEDISRARKACRLPILRKDFIFDPYQIAEARAAGADAVLLIADMLSVDELKSLVKSADKYQVEPLVEVFTQKVLPAALLSGARMIGVNARNLRTLEMNPNNIATFAPMIPRDRLLVAESGIKTAKDIEKLKAQRVGAVLVGESLLKQADVESAVRVLVEAGK